MPVEDVFSISGRGTVVTVALSAASSRSAKKSKSSASKPTLKTTCTGVEMFRKLLDQVKPVTTSASCCAAPSVKKSSVAKCWLPGSITRRTPTSNAKSTFFPKTKAVVTPFFNNYRPQFYFRTTDVTGSVTLPAGTEMVMPGDKREDDGGADCADRDGRSCALRSVRGRTVGAGVVSKIIK